MVTAVILAAIYGTLVGGNFVEAPYASRTPEGTRETASLPEPLANAVGYKLLVEDRPPCGPDEYLVVSGYLDGARITRKFEVRKVKPEPREFYKYDISAACLEAGILDKLIGFIRSDQTTSWFWDNAEIIREGDPFFVSGTNAVVSSGIVTAEQVRAILDRAAELGKEED